MSSKFYNAQQAIPVLKRAPAQDDQIERRVFREVFEAAAMDGMVHFQIFDKGWRAVETWGDILLWTFSVTLVARPDDNPVDHLKLTGQDET